MLENQSTGFNIGWIGLGKMGHPMAMNLITAGETVSVFNRSSRKNKEHAAAGGSIAASIAGLASSSEIVITIGEVSCVNHSLITKYRNLIEVRLTILFESSFGLLMFFSHITS